MALRPAEMQKCFKVTDLVKGQCIFYNSTALSSKEQIPNAIIIEHFKPLFSSSCSLYAWILVCSTFLPFCFSSHRQVQPCHHLCLAVKSSCIHHFCMSNIAWVSTLNCSKLPSPPQVCISPPLSSTLPSPISVPVLSSSAFSLSFNSLSFSIQDLILAVSLPLLCLAVFLPLILLYVCLLLFPCSQPPTSNDASVICPPHTAPPSPMPSSSSTLPSSLNHQQHQHLLCSSSSKTLSAHLPEHWQNNFIPRIRSLLILNDILSSFHFEERLCTDCG